MADDDSGSAEFRWAVVLQGAMVAVLSALVIGGINAYQDLQTFMVHGDQWNATADTASKLQRIFEAHVAQVDQYQKHSVEDRRELKGDLRTMAAKLSQIEAEVFLGDRRRFGPYPGARGASPWVDGPEPERGD